MKRSEMFEVIYKALDDGKLRPDERLRVAEHLVTGLGAVLTWEAEAPEWPELVRGGMQTASGEYRGCLLVAAIDGRRLPVEQEDGDRIARAWNARRPSGEMELCLAALCGELSQCQGRVPRPGETADRIRAALRLGVEE